MACAVSSGVRSGSMFRGVNLETARFVGKVRIEIVGLGQAYVQVAGNALAAIASAYSEIKGEPISWEDWRAEVVRMGRATLQVTLEEKPAAAT